MICPSKARVNFDEALNHDFFKLYEENEEVPSETEDLQKSMSPFINIQNFNKYFPYIFINLILPRRKCFNQEKNSFISSPICSPLLKENQVGKKSKKPEIFNFKFSPKSTMEHQYDDIFLDSNCSSPLRLSHLDKYYKESKGSLSFVCHTPLLDGHINTIDSII